MKVGDTLICKIKNSSIIKYNQSYKIIDINNNSISVDIGVAYVTFNLDEEDEYEKYLYEFFYTKEELRLLKIKSL